MVSFSHPARRWPTICELLLRSIHDLITTPHKKKKTNKQSEMSPTGMCHVSLINLCQFWIHPFMCFSIFFIFLYSLLISKGLWTLKSQPPLIWNATEMLPFSISIYHPWILMKGILKAWTKKNKLKNVTWIWTLSNHTFSN